MSLSEFSVTDAADLENSISQTSAALADPAPFVKRLSDGTKRLDLSITGAHCGGCIAKIENGLGAIPDIDKARLNLSTGRLSVIWRGDRLAPAAITAKIFDLGFGATAFDPEAAQAEEDSEGRFLLRCLAVAGFAAANIMLLSVAVWAGQEGEMGPATRAMLHWISAAIALPAAAYAGRPFFRSAARALKARRANMDVPISLAVILALGLSVYETLNHGRDAYFDAAAMLLFFLLIGRWLDHRLRAKARASAKKLLSLQASAATRISPSGDAELISAREILPGDRILLSPGDRAPVNGRIIEGGSDVDVSLVTGESAPAFLKAGDQLFAGVLNISSRLIMEARAKAEDSLIADLTRLIEAGEQSKGAYVRLADRAAALYVPLVHSLALLTFAGWFFIGEAGMRVSIMNAVAVLIITCPCALGLAAPAVQIVATGRLFREGVLVKSGDALERFADIDAIVFDKTGTLTLGRFQLTNQDAIPQSALKKAAMLARTSRHPLARAIAGAAGIGPLAEDAKEIPGCGIEGEIQGAPARLGRAEWIGVDSDQVEATQAWFKWGDSSPVRFLFEDVMRADAQKTVRSFEANDIAVEMLSGDKAPPARRVANAAGIDQWRAGLSPEDKINRLNQLGGAGMKVAMVGDGLNDAPSLAAAYASLSPGTAADASQAAADFVFQGDSLAPVYAAFDISKKARRRVIENFAFAALYNACAIPLAVFGFVTPLIAALAMSGSSIIVTLNALRLAPGARKARRK